MNLFGKENKTAIELDPDIWKGRGSLSGIEQEILVRPLKIEEMEAALKEMKNNTAPGQMDYM